MASERLKGEASGGRRWQLCSRVKVGPKERRCAHKEDMVLEDVTNEDVVPRAVEGIRRVASTEVGDAGGGRRPRAVAEVELLTGEKEGD